MSHQSTIEFFFDEIETKLKGKCEVMFGEVVGRVSGVAGGRAREGVAFLLSEWLLRCI